MNDSNITDHTVYVGVDLHKRYSTVVKKDHQGKLLERRRVAHDVPEQLARFVQSLDANCRVAIEATGNWYHFYETVESSGARVVLCHPLKTRAIASARIMTDEISADVLADLLRADLLPRAYIPDRKTRDLRELLRYRAALVAMTTQVRCRLRAVLAKDGLDCPYTDILSHASRQFLATAPLRDSYRLEVDGFIQIGRHLVAETERIQALIDQQVQLNEQARLLDTIPGVGPYTALLILAEIGDINRFPTAGHLASYAGLVPSVHSSGGHTRLGHITKQGSKWLRWVLVECWWKLINKSLRFRRYYERISHRHGSKAARVAVARKLVHVIYRMLKERVPFCESGAAPVSS